MKTNCLFPHCKKPRIARGLCGAHYSQRRKRQELRPLRGAHGYFGAVRVSFSLTKAEYARLRKMLPKNMTPGAFLLEWVRDQIKGRR